MESLKKIAVIAAAFSIGTAYAQQIKEPIKIGLLTDLSGLYSDLGGRGSVEAAKMAIEEMGGIIDGRNIELVYADTLNKSDVASVTARKWFDTENVNVVIGLPSSPVALAVQLLAEQKNKIAITTEAGSDALTEKNCSSTGAHWVYDTYAVGKVAASAMQKQGAKTWYYIQLDQVFGATLADGLTKFIASTGGTVNGSIKHPLNTSDFSSYVISAQSSGANVVAMLNAGGDTVNAIKTAKEYQLTKTQKIVAPLLFSTDVKSLGLETAQNLYLSEAYYWDLDERSRAFATKFFARTSKMPTSVQAGNYSATLHYLKAVASAKTTNTAEVMAKMREIPINDAFVVNGQLRKDGLMIHDMHVFQVKQPAESKGVWDLYKLVETVPASKAFRPLAQSECKLVQK